MYDSNSFSMLFTVPNYNNHQPYDESADVYSSYCDTSAVDCTLSLGTPSTRLSDKKNRSGFCGWSNLLKPNKQNHHQAQVSKINSRGMNGGDSMLTERRCASCDTTSTPLWRNGPRGPKSLCNACGIRYKKEERRANAAASTTTVSGGAPLEHQYILNNSWANHQNSPKYPYYTQASGNEYSFMDGTNHADVDTGIPFLSWGLNVADRPSFVHY